MVEIRRASLSNVSDITKLALCLWSAHAERELESEFTDLLKNSEAAVFLAYQNNLPIGFAQCQLRRDYVEGTVSSPVGYLEGIYVSDSYRKSGIARSLLCACENWAKEAGCKEFASDCELTNMNSLAFHLNVGFKEANRIICFTKKL